MGVWQVAVAEDHGIGVVCLQRLQQGVESSFLLRGTRVGRNALWGKTTLIAHADRVLIVMAGMCPGQVLMTRLVHMTVAGDIVVVAGEPKTGVVAGDEVLNGEPAVAARRAAVNDD